MTRTRRPLDDHQVVHADERDELLALPSARTSCSSRRSRSRPREALPEASGRRAPSDCQLPTSFQPNSPGTTASRGFSITRDRSRRSGASEDLLSTAVSSPARAAPSIFAIPACESPDGVARRACSCRSRGRRTSRRSTGACRREERLAARARVGASRRAHPRSSRRSGRRSRRRPRCSRSPSRVRRDDADRGHAAARGSLQRAIEHAPELRLVRDEVIARPGRPRAHRD